MFIELLKTLGVLAGVLGLIFLLAFAVRRLGLAQVGSSSHSPGWKILGVKSLGSRRQLYALEVGTRILVIGVNDKSITTLSEITNGDECAIVRDALTPPRRKLPLFADVMKKFEAHA